MNVANPAFDAAANAAQRAEPNHYSASRERGRCCGGRAARRQAGKEKTHLRVAMFMFKRRVRV